MTYRIYPSLGLDQEQVQLRVLVLRRTLHQVEVPWELPMEAYINWHADKQ
jgi:hypothetical protein